MSYLLDTNAVSEARKRKPDPGFTAWWERVSGSQLYLSALTVGELHRAVRLIRQRGDEEQASALDDWLVRIVQQFGDRILPVTAEITVEWGGQPRDSPLSVVDGLIAATATVHELTLITRNGHNLARTEARLHNPFTGDN